MVTQDENQNLTATEILKNIKYDEEFQLSQKQDLTKMIAKHRPRKKREENIINVLKMMILKEYVRGG